MKTTYNLTSDAWRDDFFYVWGPQATTRQTFENRAADLWLRNGECAGGFDYISALSKNKYTVGAEASVLCRFYGTGAPLIVLTDDIISSADGTPMYRLHFEVVVYKGGINVWRIVPRPETPSWPVASTKLLAIKREIEDGAEHTLSVRVGRGKLDISLGNEHYSVECDELPDIFHIGFTACEGICEFGEFSIEEN